MGRVSGFKTRRSVKLMQSFFSSTFILKINYYHQSSTYSACPTINDNTLRALRRSIEEVDIHEIVFSIKPLKTLGVDCLHATFFKANGILWVHLSAKLLKMLAPPFPLNWTEPLLHSFQRLIVLLPLKCFSQLVLYGCLQNHYKANCQKIERNPP